MLLVRDVGMFLIWLAETLLYFNAFQAHRSDMYCGMLCGKRSGRCWHRVGKAAL